MLRIDNLCVSYANKPILKHIDLSVAEGEIVGIVGESGCGKSTLLSAVMQLLDANARIDQGKVGFQERDLITLGREELRQLRGKEISMIFQNATLAMDAVRTIGSQFYETVEAHQPHISKQSCYQQAIALMNQLRLQQPEAILQSYPFENSGGMNQRIAIAMAMINNPSLILADEPTSALDVTAQAQVVNMLRQLKEKFHTAMIVVTHNMGVVAQLANKVGVMYAGRIVEWGSVEDILTNPQHPYTVALIRSIPKMDGSIPVGIEGLPPDSAIDSVGCEFAPRCNFADELCRRTTPERQKLSESHWKLCSKVENES